MVKVLKFLKQKREKGWNCWNCQGKAEGILVFINGEEIPSCTSCAKIKWKWTKNKRKPFVNTTEIKSGRDEE